MSYGIPEVRQQVPVITVLASVFVNLQHHECN
jgi:hypothetical protein